MEDVAQVVQQRPFQPTVGRGRDEAGSDGAERGSAPAAEAIPSLTTVLSLLGSTVGVLFSRLVGWMLEWVAIWRCTIL